MPAQVLPCFIYGMQMKSVRPLTEEEKAALADLAEWGEYGIFKDALLINLPIHWHWHNYG